MAGIRNTQELIDLYNNGMSLEDIADQQGMTVKNLKRRFSRVGVTAKTQKEKDSEALTAKILDMYFDQDMYAVDIAKALGVTKHTVDGRINKNKGDRSKKVEIKGNPEVLKMYANGATDKEVSQALGFKESSLRSFRSEEGIACNTQEGRAKRHTKQMQLNYDSFDFLVEQMIYGTLLGDAWIENNRLGLKHSKDQEELFLKKAELLGDFMGAYKEGSYYDNRTDKTYHHIQGKSIAHSLFGDIRKQFYIDGKRTVTKEFAEKIVHPIALAFWFMDDGHKEGVIATMGLDTSSIKILQEMLAGFGVQVTITKKNELYLVNATRPLFDNLIKPYMVPSMLYKLKY